MKTQMYKWFLLTAAAAFLFTGCSNQSDESYQNAIQKGLDAIAQEKYEKAESFFEIALDEKADDGKATAYLSQTKAYIQAHDSMKRGDLEDTKKKANEVISIKDGSEALVAKSKALISSADEKGKTVCQLS